MENLACLQRHRISQSAASHSRATEFQRPDKAEIFYLRAELSKAHFCTVQASTTKLGLCQNIKSTQHTKAFEKSSR